MINKKYSYKDFTGQTFFDVDPDEFSDLEIIGSCFAQEVPYSEDASHEGSLNHRNTEVVVFPLGMHSVVFTRCNLDNCKIPFGNTVGERNSHRKIRVQNDNQDWILADVEHKPYEPIDKKLGIRKGKSIDPKNIPLLRIEIV